MADTATTPTPAKTLRKTGNPQRERGYQVEGYTSGYSWGDITEETTPELIWPNSVFVFDRMRRTDAQVSSTLRAITTPILRSQWWVDGNGCRDEVTEFVARNLGLPIKGTDPAESKKAQLRGRDRFSFDEHLRLALLMCPFGHSYFEQVYRYDEAANRYDLRKLGLRPARTISRILVARDGGLEGIEQHGSILGPKALLGVTSLPVNRLVAYVLDREGGNWLGQSLLRSAYPNWKLKDIALRKWLTAIDRNAVGVPIYTDAPGGNTDTMDAGTQLAEDARGGDNAGGGIPAGSKFKIQGVEGQTVDIAVFVRYQDEQIARSALGHVLNLGTQVGGQVGSYNLGSVLKDTLTDGIDSIAALVAGTGSAHVVEDLVDINFGATEPAPQITYDEIGIRMSELDRIREQAGLTSDADLATFIRTNAPAPAPTQEVP